MAQKRCPICGERISNGECVSCGYALPDEDRLSAPYNLDPEDDRPEAFAPDPQKYEMPNVGGGKTAVGYDERPEMPNIEVMPTEKMRQQSPYRTANAQPKNTNTGSNTNTNWQNPYNYGSPPANNTNNQTGNIANNQPANNAGWQNPYNYNPGGQKNYGNPYSGANTDKDKVMTIVLAIMAVLAFFMPIVAIAGIITMNAAKNMEPKKRMIFKVLFILAFLASPIFAFFR